MQLQATDTSRLDWSGDGLAIGLFEDEVELTATWQPSTKSWQGR